MSEDDNIAQEMEDEDLAEQYRNSDEYQQKIEEEKITLLIARLNLSEKKLTDFLEGLGLEGLFKENAPINLYKTMGKGVKLEKDQLQQLLDTEHEKYLLAEKKLIALLTEMEIHYSPEEDITYYKNLGIKIREQTRNCC